MPDPKLPGRRRLRRGFTLIELLVVISIISLLAGLVLAGILHAKVEAEKTAARMEVSGLSLALESYRDDEGEYPGVERKPDPERNDFPVLYNALQGKRRPLGPGGRSAPYGRLKDDRIAVQDPESGEQRRATQVERHDPRVEKYYRDPWDRSYIYRANRGHPSEPFMRNVESADLYSRGPDEVDDTARGDEDADDIGNW